MHAERDLSQYGLRRLIGLLVPVVFAVAPLLVLSSVAPAQSRYVTFDPPGAVYTYPTGINKAGQIVGEYGDNAGPHSFLRNADRSIVAFDPPGAAGSRATNINGSGEITGYWTSQTVPGYQSYFRDSGGNFTAFVVGTDEENWTLAFSMNDGGSIVGYYQEDFAYHGFARDPSGTISLFDPPGSVDTIPETINQSGTISGAYYDSASLIHGFILSPSGNYTIVDVPGASGKGTVGAVINDRGQLTGAYTDGPLERGYLRSAGGAYTTFALTAMRITGAFAINDIGQIAGLGEKVSGLNAAFTRDNSGNTTVFQVPGAGLGQEYNQGTVPVAINLRGTIAGYYYDTNKVPHGFVRY